jgi:histidinol-phosphatase (PHP family)
MIYKTDYHIHTSFSDGRSAPGDYIGPAVAEGLMEIGFSEHLTLFRGSLSWSMDQADAGSYLDSIKTLKESVTDIIIKTGLEVDYHSGRENEIRSLLSGMDLDYVIGSVHYLDDSSVDEHPDYYEGKDPDRLFEAYFDQVAAAAASGLFDIIAHPDLIRIYGFFAGDHQENLYRKLAKSLKKSDVAFEVNTNGRNKPLGDFYPDRRFLHIFREENVPVCVNSDAHMPSRVGQFFAEAYHLVKLAGYSEMAVFEKRKRRLIPF